MKNTALSGWRLLLAVTACVLAVDVIAQPASQPSARPASPATVAAVKPAFGDGEALYYEFGWNGITAAEGRVWVEKGSVENEEVYTFRVAARTTSVVDKLYEFRASGWSVASADTLVPLYNRLNKTENGRKTTETVVFDRERKSASYKREKQSDAAMPPSVKNSTIQCENPGDAFAFAYVLRSQSLTVGEVKKTLVIVGRHLYEFSVTVVGRERITVKAGTFDALRLVPTFHEVGKAPDTRKVRAMVLWVSDDASHLPLKVTADAFIGHVYGELTRVEGDSKPQPPTAEVKS